LAFIKDYLKQSDGQLQPWDAETQSFIYQLDDGSYDIIMLYQPLTHPSQNAADFWAVARYEYNEQVADGEINCVAYDVRHDLWASLHVAE
jgi:hypothetical protein